MSSGGFNQTGINLLSANGQVLPTLFRYMSLDGDGVTFEATGDYSAGSGVEFYAAPASAETWMISHITIQVTDSGSMDAGSYGNGITLTNGIRVVQVFDQDAVPSASGEIDLTPDFPVLTNSEWSRYTGDFSLNEYGSGDEALTWVYVLPQIIKLDGLKGQRLGIRLNDDFTNLNHHTFSVQGAINRGAPSNF